MELRHITLEVSADHVAVVTLDKPPVNALGPAIRAADRRHPRPLWS